MTRPNLFICLSSSKTIWPSIYALKSFVSFNARQRGGYPVLHDTDCEEIQPARQEDPRIRRDDRKGAGLAKDKTCAAIPLRFILPFEKYKMRTLRTMYLEKEASAKESQKKPLSIIKSSGLNDTKPLILPKYNIPLLSLYPDL